MLDIFKKNILRLLKHSDYSPVKLGQLAKALGVSGEDFGEFKIAFDQLRQSGQLVIGARNLVSLPPMSGKVVGRFRSNPKGFGFVIPLEPNLHGDLFIKPNNTAGAMNGDIVKATVVQRGMREGQKRYSGKVVEILERGQDKFVGTLCKTSEGWFVQPDGKSFTELISVEDVGAKGAKAKDKVVVEILTYPSEQHFARGVIVEVLGKSGLYDSEIKSIIRQYHLPEAFDAGCSKQAHKAASSFSGEAVDGREDITDKVIITIDPETAKDFDDAISLERDGENWVLGVHIADVSHFIGVGSAMDIEAKERGNSIYLPQKTIPMLPEVMSNGVCSLQPGQRRFCKSAYITYDVNGGVVATRFANSVICSTKRLTYVEADRILKGHKKKEYSAEVVKLLKDMETLSRLIEKRREKKGMIHLDLPETELVFDKSGRVVDAHPADDSYPHTIIEMFMVEANDAVANVLDRLNVPLMRRIHPEPGELSMKNLSKLVAAFGLKVSKAPTRKDLQHLLQSVKGKDCSFAANMAVLRSLEKAEYSPLHIGHYALASVNYCHFTSPIRRYADLLIHRSLGCHIEGRLKNAKEGEILTDAELAEIGKHISFTEERADDAEKELKEVLLLQMLSEHIGDEMDCIITGLAGFGVFAQCQKFGVEGLIPMADLGKDDWEYNAKAQCITGVNSGYTISLGHKMRVRIISVNVPGRQLNLAPAKPLFSPKVVKKNAKGGKKNVRVVKKSKTNKRGHRGGGKRR